MALIIADEELQAAQLTEEELRLEIAILLYQQARFSMGKASAFAGMERLAFQKILGERGIPVNYDEEDWLADLNTLGISPE